MKLKIQIIQLLSLSLVLALSLTSCTDSNKKVGKEQVPINVVTQKIESPVGKGFYRVSGQIEASDYANISTRMMGHVTKVYVNIGDQVRKGQSLIDINSSDMQAKKSQAQAGVIQADARYRKAEKDLKRFTILFEQESASQKEFEDIKTNYEVAKAQLEGAKQARKEVEALLYYSNIKAPFSGIITSKSVKPGDMAKPGYPLMSIEAPDHFVAKIMVPETQISNIQKSDSVSVFVKSTQQSISGLISEVSTSSQNSGGQYLVKIELNVPSEVKLYSGMFISASLPSTSAQKSIITIPKNAIIQRGGLQGVYTVSESNTAMLRWLKLGGAIGNEIEVLSGLSEGETLITEAEGKLFNGARLKLKS